VPDNHTEVAHSHPHHHRRGPFHRLLIRRGRPSSRLSPRRLQLALFVQPTPRMPPLPAAEREAVEKHLRFAQVAGAACKSKRESCQPRYANGGGFARQNRVTQSRCGALPHPGFLERLPPNLSPRTLSALPRTCKSPRRRPAAAAQAPYVCREHSWSENSANSSLSLRSGGAASCTFSKRVRL